MTLRQFLTGIQSKDRGRERARLGEREAKPFGRVRLRPNRGFRVDPPSDVTPRALHQKIEDENEHDFGRQAGTARFRPVSYQNRERGGARLGEGD
jgi:hypothetical protein